MADSTKPLLFDDRPTSDDAFNRKPFATALAERLVLPRNAPGLVVAIEGEWGSGKTQLLNMVRAGIGDRAIAIQFNPWLVGNTAELIEAFLTQLAAAIGKEATSEQVDKGIKASKRIIQYVALLRHVKYLSVLKYVPGVSAAGSIAEDVAKWAETASDAAEKAGESASAAVQDLKAFSASIDLNERKRDAADALAGLDRSIVVFIDDLDRLTREGIRAMMQAVKAVADFDRVSYLLAYDPGNVCRSLSENGDEQLGRAYLEKIVQVSYELPKLFTWQLRTLLSHHLNEVLSRNEVQLRSFETELWEEAIGIAGLLCRHPRDTIRISNRVAISLPIVHAEVNAADVLVVEALSVRFPTVARAVKAFPQFFIGEFFDEHERTDFDWFRWASLQDEKEKTQWLTFLPSTEDEKELAEKACRFLFPRLRDDDDRRASRSHLRLHDMDRLKRFLAMASVEGTVSAESVHSLLRSATALRNALQGPEREIPALLSAITQFAPSSDIPDHGGIVQALIDRDRQAIERGTSSIDIVDSFARAIESIIAKVSDHASAIFGHVVSKGSLSISERVLLSVAAEHGKWPVEPESKTSPHDRLVKDAEVVDDAINVWCRRVRNAAEDATLSSEPRAVAILFRWAQFSGEYCDAQDALKNACAEPRVLTRLVEQLNRDGSLELGSFDLVWDIDELIVLIGSADEQRKQWETAIKRLESPQVKEYVAHRRELCAQAGTQSQT